MVAAHFKGDWDGEGRGASFTLGHVELFNRGVANDKNVDEVYDIMMKYNTLKNARARGEEGK